MKIEKDVSSTTIQTKKEAITMIKKCLAVTLAALIVIFNVLPAQAYTAIGTPVSVTASGTLTGSIVSLSASVVAQGTTTPAISKVDFTNPAGVCNSSDALKITGGTTDVDSRIIIYTDNASYYSLPDKDPARDSSTGKPTGIDGAGMPGKSSPAYVAALLWGLTSNADFASNANPASYAGFTQANIDAGTNCVYVTDLRHEYDFITQKLVDAINNRYTPPLTYTIDTIDTLTLYTTGGGAGPANTASEGSSAIAADKKLVPTLFGSTTSDGNLWDSANASTRHLIREGLYKNIATIAFGIREPDPTKSDEVGYYIAQVPNLTTASGSDNVRVKLAKHGTGATDAYLYVPIGGNFDKKPAQDYETIKLTVAMVKL